MGSGWHGTAHQMCTFSGGVMISSAVKTPAMTKVRWRNPRGCNKIKVTW